MREHIRLSAEWSLAYDSLQWILQRRPEDGKQSYWKPVGYFTSKRVLVARLREKRAEITPEAQRALGAMPEDHRDWLAQHKAWKAA